MNDAIPELSPAQKQWLDGELSSGSGLTKRVLDAMDSSEYLLSQTKQQLVGTIRTLNLIVNGELKTLRQEALGWAIISYNLTDASFGSNVQLLVSRKIVESPAFRYGNLHAENLSLLGRSIMAGMVLPYLNDKLPD